MALKNFDLLYFSVHHSKVWDYGQSLNKIIDYMLAGKPIIGSYSGFPTMINEAECGYFVPAGNELALMDKITELSLLPSSERLKMGIRGKKWLLENRSYRVLAQKYYMSFITGDEF